MQGALVNKQAWKSFLAFVISSEETPQQHLEIESIQRSATANF